MRQSKKQKLLLQFLLAAYILSSFWSYQRAQYADVTNTALTHTQGLAPRNDLHEQYHPRNPLENLSSVDYFACCGLGHRLIRMSLAHFVAKKMNFSLRSFWGWCGETTKQIEVFSYLFRPYHASEVRNVQSQNQLLPFYNEVPGFSALVRTGTTTKNNSRAECPCQTDKVAADLELYTSLRERFRSKRVVDSFVEENFLNATVIGIHVRAGNGEGGDFERKGRTIDNPQKWVGYVCSLIQNFLSSQEPLPKPPLLYIATDTPSMIPLFRQQIDPIPVMDLPQERREEGQGVLFGEADKVHNKGEGKEEDDYSSCLKGWTDTLTDMFLLSHADVVIAGKPSSFSQTLPMSLAFGNKDRKLPHAAFCEVIPQYQANDANGSTVWKEISPKLQCYESYSDWCCNYSTWIKFHHKGPRGHAKIHSKEFIKFLPIGSNLKEYPGMRNRTPGCLRPRRGRAGGGRKDKCLPHEW